MNNPLDKILTEWAYRVHNGMPNPSNSYHMVQLEQYLNELRLPRKVVKKVLEKVRKYVDNPMNKKLGRPISNNVPYFPHYTETSNELMFLERKHGAEGYRAYYRLFEMIAKVILCLINNSAISSMLLSSISGEILTAIGISVFKDSFSFCIASNNSFNSLCL